MTLKVFILFFVVLVVHLADGNDQRFALDSTKRGTVATDSIEILRLLMTKTRDELAALQAK